jgi:hypothetical protein
MITKGLKQQVFESHELSLVCALIAWGFPIISVDKTSSKRVSFSFSKTLELDQCVDDFWNDTRLVSPKKYFNAMREAKSRIYSV